MTEIFQISKTCISCDSCRLICPENSIITNGREYAIDSWSCTLCGICTEVCPVDCIKLIEND
jgi:Pyruvate/2-oxoacid:ferredoxin oxidoreductase delta subunit